MRPASRRGPAGPRPHGDDSGLTLVELLMAMGIFTVVVAISAVMLHGMTNATVRVSGTNDARTSVDRVFNRMDKQVPYASAINAAVQSGGNWWVEFRTEVSAGGLPPRCWQYRLNTSARVVEFRSWPIGNASGVTAWTTLATGARARTGAGAPPPFRTVTSSDDVVRQRLVLAFDIAPVGAPVVPLETTYVARNTSAETETNVSGVEVCREVARA